MLITKILKELEDPTNREIVNNGQDEFEVCTKSWGTTFAFTVFDKDLDMFREAEQLFVIRHCINLLPCFDVEHKDTGNYTAVEYELMQDTQYYKASLIRKLPQTIRQSLLCSGAMTVQELEQEYIKLIK